MGQAREQDLVRARGQRHTPLQQFVKHHRVATIARGHVGLVEVRRLVVGEEQAHERADARQHCGRARRVERVVQSLTETSRDRIEPGKRLVV